MNAVLIGALVALTAVQQTDTVIPLEGATRLEIEAAGGSIRVATWDRNEIRIQAEHSSRTFIDIDRSATTVSVEADARRGPANLVDFVLTVPPTLELELDGMYTDMVVEGADGAVSAETLQGDVTIRGGRGSVEVGAVSGRILVEGARGVVDVETAAGDIRVRDSSGEIYGESAGGDIVLEDMRATAVDVGAVGGRVYYRGTFDPEGAYFLGSHGGSVTVVVPDGVGATFNLATVHGTITTNLEGAPRSFERGKRHRFEVGGGGALVEVETFGGRIAVLREGSPGARPPAEREARAGHGAPSPSPEFDPR